MLQDDQDKKILEEAEPHHDVYENKLFQKLVEEENQYQRELDHTVQVPIKSGPLRSTEDISKTQVIAKSSIEEQRGEKLIESTQEMNAIKPESITKAKARFQLARCPHCGRKVGLFESWMIKNKGEYFCDHCSKVSNVVLDPMVLGLCISMFALSIVLILIFSFTGMKFYSVVLIFLPFLLFFICSLFLVRLKVAPEKVSKKKKKK